MTVDYEALRKRYDNAGQGHVFTFFQDLTTNQQEEFLNQLSKVDVENVVKISKTVVKSDKETAIESQDKLDSEFAPLPSNVIGDAHASDRDEWYKKGLELISQNQIAVILMAGGQGSRLGSPDPKGCFNVGLPSQKPLFQLQAERIRRLQTLAAVNGKDAVIPWYIMTSGPTDKSTRDFFLKHDYFGLLPDNVIFFQQGVLPCLTNDGKFMLQEKGKLAVSPDGNGGIYNALHKQDNLLEGSVIDSLNRRGILYSHCYCVDNSLARVADPVFIGYCASRDTDCGIKVVSKSMPEEPVGVIALRGGKYGVVEYSEISSEMAHMRLDDGRLAFGAANIVNHFFSTKFLERVPDFSDLLEYHIAKKKIPYIDLETGEAKKPDTPNGIKLERFVFDVFPHSDSFSVLEVNRLDEFSPLKNKAGTGVDCPETSRAHILEQAKRFIENAGGKYDTEDIEIEISPLLSYGGENLEALNGAKIIKSGILNTLEDTSLII